MIEIHVAGVPRPAGSKRIVTARGGDRKGRPILIDDASNIARGWKKAIRQAALDRIGDDAPLTGAVEVLLVFVMPRPAGHWGTGRNAAKLRSSAPSRPTVKPDVLKLARLVEDELTGIVYRDDAQIVHETISKRYVEPGEGFVGVQIFVWPYGDGESPQLRIEEGTHHAG